MLSNDTWAATDEGGDCEVVWTVVGNVTAPGACATCQIGLSLTASIDRGSTTCPQGVWAGEETMQESYNVYLGSDGSSIWYFGGSGTQFAVGELDGNAMNYLSEGACNFWGGTGSTECTDMQ